MATSRKPPAANALPEDDVNDPLAVAHRAVRQALAAAYALVAFADRFRSGLSPGPRADPKAPMMLVDAIELVRAAVYAGNAALDPVRAAFDADSADVRQLGAERGTNYHEACLSCCARTATDALRGLWPYVEKEARKRGFADPFLILVRLAGMHPPWSAELRAVVAGVIRRGWKTALCGVPNLDGWDCVGAELAIRKEYARVRAAVGRTGAGAMEASSGAAGAGTTPTSGDSYLTPGKLAELFNVRPDALRSRLNRWRARNHTGWIENAERGPREAKYLYRVGSVRPIIGEMKATSERPAKRNRRWKTGGLPTIPRPAKDR